LAIVVASRFGDFNFAFCTGDGEAGSSINEGVPVLHACGSHDDGLREGRAGREFSSSWKKTDFDSGEVSQNQKRRINPH
jgi:hypothetical protein